MRAAGKSHRFTDSFLVYPIVGVRHQEVQRLVGAFVDRKPSQYIPPTVSTPLVTLSNPGTFNRYPFVRGEPMAEEARNLARAVADFGVPFMQATQTLESVLQRIDARQGHGLELNGPVVCLLMGDRPEADRRISAELAKVEGLTTPYAEFFRGFARRFTDYANEHYS